MEHIKCVFKIVLVCRPIITLITHQALAQEIHNLVFNGSARLTRHELYFTNLVVPLRSVGLRNKIYSFLTNDWFFADEWKYNLCKPMDDISFQR